MTLSDLESLSEIFNDTKLVAASLRQLSFLLVLSYYLLKLTKSSLKKIVGLMVILTLGGGRSTYWTTACSNS